MRPFGAALALSFAAAISCGGSNLGPANDGSVPAVALQVGGGEFDFDLYSPGERVEVVCGNQGGQHIWVSARARNLDVQKVNLQVEIRIVATGSLVCGQEITDVRMFEKDGWGEYTGIACFVAEPLLIEDRQVRITVTVSDSHARSATSSVEIVPFGPTQSCALTP